MPSRWVVNASPIILLAKIGRLGWLEELSDELSVPAGVADEIRAGPEEDSARGWLTGDGRARIRTVEQVDSAIAAWDLGIGESEVLAWARQHAGYEAILDDRAARNCATTLRIPVRGTLGIVLLAKREGLVSKAEPVLRELMQAGLRIDERVFQTAMKLADE